MLEAVSATELAFAVLVVFFACTVFSAMGFGIGIVGLPFLFLMFDPATAIILLNVMALPVVILVVLRNREHLRPRQIVPIVVAGVVGAFIGGRVLKMLDLAEYKDIFGIAVLVVIIALTVGGMFKVPFSMPRASILGPVCGFLVGVFITGIGVGGAAAGAVLHIAGLGPSEHSRIHGAVLHIHGDCADSDLRAERPLYARSQRAADSVYRAGYFGCAARRPHSEEPDGCRVAARGRDTCAGIQRVCACDEGGECGGCVATIYIDGQDG